MAEVDFFLSDLYSQIDLMIVKSKTIAAHAVNNATVLLYWHICESLFDNVLLMKEHNMENFRYNLSNIQFKFKRKNNMTWYLIGFIQTVMITVCTMACIHAFLWLFRGNGGLKTATTPVFI